MNKIEQSYKNLEKALLSLEKSIATPPTEDRDFGGIIQAFISTYELTWKCLQKILVSEGIEAPFPRVVFEEAYKRKMIFGNDVWKKIIKARNQAIHTYNKEMAVSLCTEIMKEYTSIFRKSFNLITTFVNPVRS